MKYYFEHPDSENCYLKDHFIEEMKDREVSEMEVYPAKIIYGTTPVFWCDEFNEVGETGASCGKFCGGYKPRNGKNGRCKHHKNTYEPSDKPIIIKI